MLIMHDLNVKLLIIQVLIGATHLSLLITSTKLKFCKKNVFIFLRHSQGKLCWFTLTSIHVTLNTCNYHFIFLINISWENPKTNEIFFSHIQIYYSNWISASTSLPALRVQSSALKMDKNFHCLYAYNFNKMIVVLLCVSFYKFKVHYRGIVGLFCFHVKAKK